MWIVYVGGGLSPHYLTVELDEHFIMFDHYRGSQCHWMVPGTFDPSED